MDRVYDLIQETLAEVNRRWDLIGYSDETRMASIEAFTESIKCVCNEMVAQLQSEVASFELEEERTLDQIRHLALRLGDGEIELVRFLSTRVLHLDSKMATTCSQMK